MEYNRSEELIKLGMKRRKPRPHCSIPFPSMNRPGKLIWRSARHAVSQLLAPQFVEVAGTSPKLAKAIENDLKDNIGKPVDTAVLQNQLMDLKGDGRFTNLSYQMTSRDGKPGLLVTGVEKPYSPPIVQPLLLFDGQILAASISAWVRVLPFWIWALTAPNCGMMSSSGRSMALAASITVRSRPPASGSSRPNAFADYQQYPIYEKDVFVAEYRKTSAGGGLELGYEFDRVAQLTLGYTAAYQTFVPKIGNQTLLPNVSGRFGGTTLRLR